MDAFPGGIMPDTLLVICFVSAALAVASFIASIGAIRRKRVSLSVFTMMLTVVFFLGAGLCGAITAGTRGYRALTHEEVAAIVITRPTGIKTFSARFRFPDGREIAYNLAGDELYIDAHILKWRPFVNVLGLHTTYQLDRVAGRYANLEDEKAETRTVFALGLAKPFDVFNLRRRFPVLKPLVDAGYGSATFVAVDRPARFEVRVSTTGLLIRPVESAWAR